MKTKKEEPSQEQIENEIMEDMTKAHAIAKTLFGERSNAFAVFEIYDYLQGSEEEEFARDLKRIIESAKIVFETDTPTPEMVFGLFGRAFGIES